MVRNLKLEEQTVRALQAQAAARNMPLDRYLRALADNSDRILGPASKSPHDLTPSEFTQWLIDVAADMPDIPPLPADFSRADIYSDHD
jgi:hypothetical protein